MGHVVKIDEKEVAVINDSSFVEKVVAFINYEPIRQEFTSFLRHINWSEAGISLFHNVLSKWDTQDQLQLFKYTQNRTITIDDVAKDHPVNIIDLFAYESGVRNKDRIRDLLSLRWINNGLGVGEGEAFLSLIIKDGRRPVVGDLQIGDSIIECKASGARVMGMSGFIGSRKMLTELQDFVLDFARKNNYKIDMDRFNKPNSFNLKVFNGGGMFFESIGDIVKHRGFDLTISEKQDISKAYCESMCVVLEFLKPTVEIEHWIVPFIPDNGQLSKEQVELVIRSWFKHWFKYYSDIDKFDYICCINSASGNVLMRSAEDFLNQYQTHIDKKHIRLGQPGFYDPGRGKSYSITLK